MLCPGAPFAGTARSTLSDRYAANVATVSKVKARQEITGLEGQQFHLAMGNFYADMFAKKGARLHFGLSQEAQEALEQEVADVQQVACLVANLWHLWPGAEKLGRRQGEARPPRVPPRRHQLVDMGAWWSCRSCQSVLLKSSQPSHKVKLDKRVCKGAAKATSAPGLGHSLVVAAYCGTSLFFCSSCGAYSVATRHKLAGACEGAPTAAGRRALAKLLKGRRPEDSKLLEGMREVSSGRLFSQALPPGAGGPSGFPAAPPAPPPAGANALAVVAPAPPSSGRTVRQVRCGCRQGRQGWQPWRCASGKRPGSANRCLARCLWARPGPGFLLWAGPGAVLRC